MNKSATPTHVSPSLPTAAAHAIFEAAKSRVYRLKQQGSGTGGTGSTGAQAQPRKRKQAGGGTGEGDATAAAAVKPAPTVIEAVLESMPKWELLREVGAGAATHAHACYLLMRHALWAKPRHAMPCLAMPCHVCFMPCHAMPCHATPCHAMPCHAICRYTPGAIYHAISL